MSRVSSSMAVEDASLENTPTTRIWLAEDGIMHYQTLPDAEESLTDIQARVDAVWQCSERHPFPHRVDLSGSRSISKEARKYLTNDEAAHTTCGITLLAKSRASRIIGSFFLAISQPPFPLRLLIPEAQALGWLHLMPHCMTTRT